MEDAKDPKTYECAYLLKPSIPETEVNDYAFRMTHTIEENKGVIMYAQEPRNRMLAYPIKKERRAYFGWIDFRLPPERITDVVKTMKGAEYLLRHLIIEQEAHKKTVARALSVRKSSAASRQRPILREQEKPEEKLDLEALDKKLEEILGK